MGCVFRWRNLGAAIGMSIAFYAHATDVDALLARCAPNVHPETMRAVLSAESRGNVLAVADAGPVALPWSKRKHMVRSHYPNTLPEAVTLVTDLLARGHTVSMGLLQINDRNLPRLGLSVSNIFEPCTNVKAGAAILTEMYERAVKQYGVGAKALRAALSGYNSGSFVRGEADGYVDLVFNQVGRPLVLRQGSGRGVSGGGMVVPALRSEVAAAGPGITASKVQLKAAARGKRSKVDRGDFTMIVTSFDAQ
jgi:hypothetical protein